MITYSLWCPFWKFWCPYYISQCRIYRRIYTHFICVGFSVGIPNDHEGILDEPIEDGDTALHLTCLYGHFACVQLLLDKGANLMVQDEDGAIPLHDACAGGFIEIVQLLLSKGAQTECVKRMLESVDSEGDTPLHHAARGEHSNIVSYLLTHGASPSKKNIYGKIPGELAEDGTETRRTLEAAALAQGSQ